MSANKLLRRARALRGLDEEETDDDTTRASSGDSSGNKFERAARSLLVEQAQLEKCASELAAAARDNSRDEAAGAQLHELLTALQVQQATLVQELAGLVQTCSQDGAATLREEKDRCARAEQQKSQLLEERAAAEAALAERLQDEHEARLTDELEVLGHKQKQLQCRELARLWGQ